MMMSLRSEHLPIPLNEDDVDALQDMRASLARMRRREKANDGRTAVMRRIQSLSDDLSLLARRLNDG